MSLQVQLSFEEQILNRIHIDLIQKRKEDFFVYCTRAFSVLRSILQPLYDTLKEDRQARQQAERDLGNVIDQRNILAEALKVIGTECGRVCDEFETCQHPSCADSCHSHLRARDALREAGYELP